MSAEAAWRIRCPNGYLTAEQQKVVHSIVTNKVALDDLVGSWNMVGPDAICTYSIRARPPRKVILADIETAVDGCKEWELVAGLAAKGRPVIVSLADDSPHLCCSAASGSGKTILAMTYGIQILRRGGRVIILDKKGSHRWANDLSGVTYYRTIPDMHDALIGLASLGDARNDQAAIEPEDWDPGERIFIIFEETNATIARLKAYWDANKSKLWTGEGKPPRVSPAIQGYRDIAFMGRSAKMNLFAIAQMLTVDTTGGTQARENYSIRCLARYTANNWKMLCPECPMPSKSKIRGRWQIVYGGVAHETQVPFDALEDGRTLDKARVMAFAQQRPPVPAVHDVRTEPPAVGSVCSVSSVAPGSTSGVRFSETEQPNTVGPVRYTLAEASRAPWCSLTYDALRMARARFDGWPAPVMRGSRETWTEDELRTALGDRILERGAKQ